MKLLGIVVGLASFSLCGCTSGDDSNELLEFEESSWAFGEVLATDVLEHRFVARNTSGREVVVEGVRKSCGCASAEFSPLRLAPGDVGELVVSIDELTVGKRMVTATLIGDHGVLGQVRMSYQLTPESTLAVEPSMLTVRPGACKDDPCRLQARVDHISQSHGVKGRGDSPVRIHTPGGISAELVHVQTRQMSNLLWHSEYDLLLELRSSDDVWRDSNVLRVKIETDSSATSTLTVRRLEETGRLITRPKSAFVAVGETDTWRRELKVAASGVPWPPEQTAVVRAPDSVEASIVNAEGELRLVLQGKATDAGSQLTARSRVMCVTIGHPSYPRLNHDVKIVQVLRR